MIFTEKEIKEWFEDMKNKYPNSRMLDSLTSVELAMFYDEITSIAKRKGDNNYVGKSC